MGFWRVVGQNAPSLYRFTTWGFSESDSTATFRLESVGGKIRVTATASDGRIETIDLRARSHSDGTVRLRGGSLLVGAPPVVWGLKSLKSRLALNTSGDLVYDSNGGSIGFFTLIPIVAGGGTSTWTFQRIE